jgi:hypothetical protein
MASMGNAQRGALGGLAKLGEGARTTSDLSRVGGGLSRGANEGKKLNAAPWSDTFPAAGATLDLDFANNRGFVRGVGQGGVMDAITFTRASNGTFVKPDGTLSTHANQGALGNNLLNFPQDFDNAAWVKLQTSVIPKAEIAPDNTLSSFVLIETTSNSIHYTYQPITVVRQSIYTSSVYIKNKDRQYARLSYVTSSANNGIYADFDLVNGVIINQGAVGTGVLSSANIVDAGNGWYRCQVTGSQDTATNAFFVVTLRDDTDNHTTEAQQAYLGDGESGIFIWGAQLEVGSTATEYFPTNIGEPRFDWASTEQVEVTNKKNLLSNTQGLNFIAGTRSTTITRDQPDAFGGNTASLATANTNTDIHTLNNINLISNLTVGETYTLSWIIKGAGIGKIRTGLFLAGAGISGYSNLDLISGTIDVAFAGVSNISLIPYGIDYYLFSFTFVAVQSQIGIEARITNDSYVEAWTGDGTSGFYSSGIQLELGSTVTTYEPEGPSAILTPLRANPTSNGILIEEARTNRLLWNRDATQTQWVKTNITAAKDQTGIDGVANAASSLTATDDNGTCIQTITLAAGNRTGSVYLKRLTGTGNVQVTLDGSTYSTVELSDTEWYRIVLSGSVTNPTVGIKIVVDGDAVAMDYGQVEDGLFVTSPILTTTATATRAVDLAEIAGSNFSFFTQQEETSIVEFLGQGVTAGLLLNSANIGNLQILNTGVARHANGISNLDSSANYTAGNFGKAAISGNRAKRVVALNGITSVVNPQPVRSTTTVANVRIGGTAVTIKRTTMLPKTVTESALETITK